MKRIRNAVFAGMTGCLLAVCGIAGAGEIQDEQQIFDQVASKLDKGGTYFSVQNNKYYYKNIAEGFDAIQQVIMNDKTNAAQNQQAIMIMRGLKALVLGLGVNELQAFGSSSTLLEPESANQTPLFRNRLYFYHGKQNPAGLLWQSGTVNHDLDAIYLLPKDTVYAVSCELYPAKIWDWTKGLVPQLQFPPAQAMTLQAEMNFQQQFQAPLPEFLSKLGGTWTLAVTYKKNPQGSPVMQGILMIPVADQQLFDLIAKKVAAEKNITVDSSNLEIKFSIPDNVPPACREILAPVIKQEGKVLYFASNAAILADVKAAAANRDGLVSTPGYKRLAANLPVTGTGFAFSDGAIGSHILEMVKFYGPNKDIPDISRLLDSGAIYSVAVRGNDGIEVTANASMDLTSMGGMQTNIAATAIVAGMMLPALNAAREKARVISCASNLKQIGLALAQYAVDSQDNFPVEDNAAGLSELVKKNYLKDLQIFVCPSTSLRPAANGQLTDMNCSYIYFGGFGSANSGQNIPLAFEKPRNHRNSVNVLFSDFHVSNFTGGPFNTCTDVVNFLNRQYKYSPELLKTLLEKARKIDAAAVRPRVMIQQKTRPDGPVAQ